MAGFFFMKTRRNHHLALGLSILATAMTSSLYSHWGTLTALLLLIWAGPILYAGMEEGYHWDKQDALALLWLIWLSASLVWTSVAEFSEAPIICLSMLPVAFLAWRRWNLAEVAWRYFSATLWVFAAILALWGILEPPEHTVVAKPDGPFIDPNLYAASLNLLGLPLLAIYLRDDAWRPHRLETVMLLVIGLIALAFFFASSRGATLAAMALIPFILWQARQGITFNKKLFHCLAVVASAYFLAQWGMEQNVGDQFAKLSQGGDSTRLQIWKATWAMILQAPWLGSGFGSFRLMYPFYREASESTSAGGWTHNDYLQIWQEGGLFSLLLVVIFGAVLLREAWNRMKLHEPDSLEKLGLLAGALAVLLHAGVNFILFFPNITILLGIYWARASGAPSGGMSSPGLSKSLAASMPLKKALFWVLLFFVGYHLMVSTAIQYVLACSQPGLKMATFLMPGTSPFALAHGLSILRPSASQPHLMMALILDQRLTLQGTGDKRRDALIFEEADRQFDIARERLPCLTLVGIYQADFLLRHAHFSDDGKGPGKAQQVMRDNLRCNPRHGLSHAYLALAQHATGEGQAARLTLRNAYPKPIFDIERPLLVAAWMQVKGDHPTPGSVELTRRIASHLLEIEMNPSLRSPQSFWSDVNDELFKLILKERATRPESAT